MSGRQRNKTESLKNSYQTFKSIARGVPVVVVVTGLDDFPPGDRVGWWKKNAEKLGMDNNPGYHACVITLPKDDVRGADRKFYDQSCLEVKKLIRRHLT